MSHSEDGKNPTHERNTVERNAAERDAAVDKAAERDEQDRVRDIERTRELLDRTVRFLSRCTEDPRAALDSEDPRDLIRGLEALATGPEPAHESEAADSKPPIQIRRRRSA